MVLDKLVSLLGGGLLTGADGLVKTIFGSRQDRDVQEHTEQMTVMQAFAAEFGFRENRTWWDSLVDGLNRLPRPIYTFGTIWFFWYCVEDPEGFALAMQSLALMPDYGWGLFGVIATFWFGGKFLGKDLRRPAPLDPKALRELMQLRDELELRRAQRAKPPEVVVDKLPPPAL